MTVDDDNDCDAPTQSAVRDDDGIDKNDGISNLLPIETASEVAAEVIEIGTTTDDDDVTDGGDQFGRRKKTRRRGGGGGGGGSSKSRGGKAPKATKAPSKAAAAKNARDLKQQEKAFEAQFAAAFRESRSAKLADVEPGTHRRQLKQPADEDLLNWSHHCGVAGLEKADPVLFSVGGDLVSFVFGLEVPGRDLVELNKALDVKLKEKNAADAAEVRAQRFAVGKAAVIIPSKTNATTLKQPTGGSSLIQVKPSSLSLSSSSSSSATVSVKPLKPLQSGLLPKPLKPLLSGLLPKPSVSLASLKTSSLAKLHPGPLLKKRPLPTNVDNEDNIDDNNKEEKEEEGEVSVVKGIEEKEEEEEEESLFGNFIG